MQMEDSGKRLTLGDKWSLFTGGGWKLNDKEMIIQIELFKKVEQVLGIPHINCRDTYGSTESTTPFTSCEGHYYHVPYTFVHPFVLDDDLEPKGFGEHGRFAFINTLHHVIPGYFITGDRVKLLENCPSCNRHGPVISPPVTRMPSVEDRGCYNVIRRLMAEEASKT